MMSMRVPVCSARWGSDFLTRGLVLWHGLEENFCTRSFSALSPGHLAHKHQQLQIVNALHLGDKDKASSLLSNLRGDCFFYILEYCARAPDPLFALQTWKTMNEKSIHVNKRYWAFLVQALCKGGYLKEALGQLTFFGENDLMHPNLPLYNIFLNGCVNSQSLAYTNSCLKLMEQQLIGKSEITYWEFLKVAVWQGNLSGVYELWRNLRNYYNPSIISLRKFIWSFTKLGDLQAAYTLLQHMVSEAMHGADCLTVSSEKKIQSSRLDIPIPPIVSCHDDMADAAQEASIHEDIYNPMSSSYVRGCEHPVMQGLSVSSKEIVIESDIVDVRKKTLTLELRRVLRWSFNDLIHAFAQCREYNMTEKLFVQMHELQLEPSPHTFDGFIRAVISEKGVAYAMRVVDEMGKRNLKPNNNTISTLSVAYSEILELDIAESLLGQILDCSPKYIHPFNAYLSACNVTDQPERAVGLLAKMKHLNVKPTIRTYELLFQLFGNVNAPYEKGNIFSHAEVKKRIETLENDMIHQGIQHSFVSLEILIRAFGNEGMITEMLQYFHLAQTLFLHPKSYSRTPMYNNVLQSLVDAKEGRLAVEIFREMLDSDSPPDSATYNIMIDCCSLLRCFISACSLLSLMLRSGFFPQTVTYTSLIKILLSNREFNASLNLVEQLTSSGIEPDVILFNTILLEANRKGRIDIIEMIIEQMHQQKVRPDPSTCRHVFSAYARYGFHGSAMEALQVLSLRMISEEDKLLLQGRLPFFEELVYGEDLDVDSHIVNIFEEVNEYFAVALMNLRLCAISGCLISWEPEESSWARRLASSYNSGWLVKQ